MQSPKEVRRRPFQRSVKLRAHHSRADCQRKRKLPEEFRPGLLPRIQLGIANSNACSPEGERYKRLVHGLPVMNWARFFVWLADRLVIYFSCRSKRSKLRGQPGVAASRCFTTE